MRAAERYTIAHSSIASIDLMERAAVACTQRLLSDELRLNPGSGAKLEYLVVCGTGNNGGDGLAIARSLAQGGRTVQVLVVGSLPGTDDHQENLALLRTALPGDALPKMLFLSPDTSGMSADLPLVAPGTIIVDALFGTGLNRPIEGTAKEVVAWMNAAKAPIVSIDLPSGLMADGTILDADCIVQAERTLTFHCPKPAFFFRECSRYVGEWAVLPIGLDTGFITGLASEFQQTERSDVVDLLLPHHRFAHKGDNGHALLIAGSEGMMGAAVLATCAALRSGTGLVTVHVPRCGVPIVQTIAPEAICSVDEHSSYNAQLPDLSQCTAIGIGPGLGRKSDALVKLLIQGSRVPLLLDADALNALADNKTWLAFLPKGTVLTPHPKEFDRLFGACSSGRERTARAQEEAHKRGLVIVLKGACTAVCAPSGKVYFNTTGDPGMAKGGSGDVLTGLLTGALARGLSPLEAALAATYVHGAAGTLAAQRVGRDGMTAMDIVHNQASAWQDLRASGSEDPVQ